MTRDVRIRDPRELIHLPTGLIQTGAWIVAIISWLWMCIRYPQYSVAVVLGIAVTIQYNPLAGIITALAWLALCLALWIGVATSRGSATGARAILTALSRARKIRRGWDRACALTGMVARSEGYAMPILGWQITQTGVRVTVANGAIAKSSKDTVKVADQLGAFFFADRCVAKIESLATTIFHFDWGRHLSKVWAWHELPPAVNPYGIRIGIGEDGEPVELDAFLSVLVSGASGAGKSGIAWNYILGLIEKEIPFRLRIIDPKRVEFHALKEQLNKNGIVHQYITREEDLHSKEGGFFYQVNRAMEARFAQMEEDGTRQHIPTAEHPLEVIIVDELLPLTGEMRRLGTSHGLGKPAYAGRAVGWVVIALTQLAQKNDIGSIRDLFPQRVSLRQNNSECTDAALGDNASRDGARCHELDAAYDRGVFFVRREGEAGYRRGRSALITDSETLSLARGELPNDAPMQLDRETGLYRYYNAEGRLLYVGKTYDLQSRTAQHMRDANEPWTIDIDMSRTTWELYPSRLLASIAEVRIIRKEKPLHNRHHNRRLELT